VRKALGIEFEGYTHPERFMILTTTDNLGIRYPGCTRNYISDPDAWFSVFKVSGDEAARCGGCCPRQDPSRPTTN
jgi:3-(3-hydroxy-phenyl)propionate hydroxylase